jgi:FkbM family methyltransferase
MAIVNDNLRNTINKMIIRLVSRINGYAKVLRAKGFGALYLMLSRVLGMISDEFKAKLLQDLTFSAPAKFHRNIICRISSPQEYKRSQQVLPGQIVKWMDSFDPDDVFYDVGANIGMFSLYAGVRHHGSVKIVAFEPSFSTFDALMSNAVLNHLTDSLWCFQVALAEKSRRDVFNYKSVVAGGADHSLGAPVSVTRKKFNPVISQQVICYSLDEFIANFELPLPNHIKIDVDGGEFDVLRGAKATLKSGAVKTLLVEIMDFHEGDERTKNIARFMNEHGYEVVDTIDHNKKGGYPRVADYLFRRS